MNFIKRLQSKPYDEKIRILWAAVIVSAIFLVIIWFLTIKFRSMPQTNSPMKFQEIFRNIKDLKSKFNTP